MRQTINWKAIIFWRKQAAITLQNLMIGLYKFSQHPIWYIIVISVLVGAGQLWGWSWWMVTPLALGWGVWLLWQFFQADFASVEAKSEADTYLLQARRYQAQIEYYLETTTTRYSSTHHRELLTQVEVWVEAIGDLEQYLSKLRQNVLIQQDIDTVPQRISDLKERINQETDALMRRQLEGMLTNRQKQIASLSNLWQNINQAEVQIENTLALLGTIYVQLLTGQSTNQVADYRRLAADVEEETHRLQDQLEALLEVKQRL